METRLILNSVCLDKRCVSLQLAAQAKQTFYDSDDPLALQVFLFKDCIVSYFVCVCVSHFIV